MKLILTFVLANLFAWPVVSLLPEAIPTYSSEWSNSSTTRIVFLDRPGSSLESISSSLAAAIASSLISTSSDLQPCTTTIHQTYADNGITQKVSMADETGSCLYTTYIVSSAGPTGPAISFIAESTASASPYNSLIVAPVRESSAVLSTAVLTTPSPSITFKNTKPLLTSLTSETTSSNTFTTTQSPISPPSTLNTLCTAEIWGHDMGGGSTSYTTYSKDYHCAFTAEPSASPIFQTSDTDSALSDVGPIRSSGTSGSNTDTTALHSTMLLASKITVQSSSETATLAVTSHEDTSITANPATLFMVSSQILTPNGAITVSDSQGTSTISLASSATVAVVNGETLALPSAVITDQDNKGTATPPATAAIVLGSSTITENSASEFVIESQTLRSDSPITVTNSQGTTTFSLAPSNTAVVVNGATSQIAPIEIGTSPTPAVITIGSSAYTQNSASAFIVGSQTLSQGSDITIAGTTVSLASSATAIVVNGVTSVLPTPTVESSAPGAEQEVPKEFTIGSSVITAISASDAFAAGSQTLVPGAEVAVSGTTISLFEAASAIVVNGATSSLPTPTTTSSPQELIVGSSVFTANSESAFAIGSQTLVPGAQITVSGTTISLASSVSAVVVNGVTSNLSIPTQVSENNNANTLPQTASAYLVAGQTLAPGNATTVQGNTLSPASSGTGIVINSITSAFPTPGTTTTAAPQEITIGSSVVAENSVSDFVIGSETLSPGAQITVSGTTISLVQSATAVVVNGVTSDPPIPATTLLPEVTLRSSVLTTNSASAFVFATQTLSPGSQITVSGTTLSLAPSASAIVVNGKTSQVSIATGAPAASEITLGSSVLTANTASEFIVASQTLSPGSAITVSGTTLSLAQSITAVIINGKTMSISVAHSTTPEIVLGSSTFTENPASTAFVIAGQTLTPGETITASSTTIALLPSDNGVVINGATSMFTAAASVTPAPQVLTVGSQVYTATSGAFVLGGQTLSSGGAIVVSGTVVSLGPSGAVIGVMSTLSNEIFAQSGSATSTTGPSYTDSLATATAMKKNSSASDRCCNMFFVWIGVILGGLIF